MNLWIYEFVCERNDLNLRILLKANKKINKPQKPAAYSSLGYKDSNLEMTESESVALPFGDSPLCYFDSHISDCEDYYTYLF